LTGFSNESCSTSTAPKSRNTPTGRMTAFSTPEASSSLPERITTMP
jgi:hypothetical protein